MIASERFACAAMLGVAMAEETQRILRLHLKPAEVALDGTVPVQVPFPDSALLWAVLDVAAECFGVEGDSVEETHQAALDTLLQLADLDNDSQLNMGVG